MPMWEATLSKEEPLKAAVQAALQYARKSPYPQANEMLTDIYSEPLQPAWYLRKEALGV